jgi:hypothetical protein
MMDKRKWLKSDQKMNVRELKYVNVKTNKLEGLGPQETAETIHNDVREALEPAANNVYSPGYGSDTKDEFVVLSHFSGSQPGSIIQTNDPDSDEVYLTLSVEVVEETAVVVQRNVGSTDSYRAYVGDAHQVMPALYELLQKSHFEVKGGSEEINPLKEVL